MREARIEPSICFRAWVEAYFYFEEVKAFQHQLVRLYSLLYGCALQQVATMDEKTFDLFGLDGFEEHSLAFLQSSHDRCEITLQWIQRLIVESDSKQLLKIAPPILSRVFNELGNGIVNLNNARKITDFPIPFHLAQLAAYRADSSLHTQCFVQTSQSQQR